MSDTQEIWIEGIGVWADGLPDWAALQALVAGAAAPDPGVTPDRPPADVLAPGERRRAPASVRLAVEAASQAVAMSGREASVLPCVFSSGHGDAPIMDYMCQVLADAPRELSPTRFHNSVHNAAAGYWTIATGCHATSSAVCAWHHSFGAGLLEAVTLALAEDHPVLLVAYDVPGTGPLGEQIASTQRFACALVLAPATSPAARFGLRLQLQPAAGDTAPEHPCLAEIEARNVAGAAASLLEALAAGPDRTLSLQVAPGLGLRMTTMEVSGD